MLIIDDFFMALAIELTLHGIVYLWTMVMIGLTGLTIQYALYDDVFWKEKMNLHARLPQYFKQPYNITEDYENDLDWISDPSQLGGIWGTPGNPAKMTWAEALQACEDLDYAGFQDWRLPNINELRSLIDYGKSDPAIDEDLFPNTPSEDYWSSSVTQYGCENTYHVDMLYGHTGWEQDLELEKLVRPVRGKPKRRWMKKKK